MILAGAVAAGAFAPQRAGAQAAAGTRATVLPGVVQERLGNGLRLVHLPTPDPTADGHAEIAFGYVPADAGAGPDRDALRELVAAYLSFSVPARSVALAAHLAGGEFEFFDASDRIGMRIRLPRAGLVDVSREIARYFAHTIISFEVLEHARLAIEDAPVEPPGLIDEIRGEVEAVLFDRPPPVFGDAPDAPRLPDVQTYFNRYFGTERAYVIASEALPPEARALLGAVVTRGAAYQTSADIAGREEIELRFPSRPVGGMILATMMPSPRYETWFSAQVIDGFLRRQAGPDVRFDYRIQPGQSIHRIEMPVELPDHSEDARDEWLDRIRNMVFDAMTTAELDALKDEVRARLLERPMLEWFATEDLWDALRSGWAMLDGLTPDGLRARAVSFRDARRVVALWSPAFDEPSAIVESLDAVPESASPAAAEPPPPVVRPVPGRVPVPSVSPGGADPSPVRLDRLASGVTLAEGDRHMIFVGGRFTPVLDGGTVVWSGANGVLWAFPREPSDRAYAGLEGVRADRLLVFHPPDGRDDARARFDAWSGGAADDSPRPAVGDFATVDVPGLVVLKTWLEARVIEAGWSGRVGVAIDGLEGSRLLISGDAPHLAVVRSWIADLAEAGLEDGDFERVRSAAVEHYRRLRPELQIILWQRNPDGTISVPRTVTLTRLRRIAGRISESLSD